MSHILTTVYATDGGDDAASYAAALADALALPLRIIYPFTVPITIGEMPMPLMPVEDIQRSATERLSAVKEKLAQQYSALSITTEPAYGVLADLLDTDDDTAAPLLTIISNDEAEDADSWMGDETADILREGRRPVLAVPQKAAFRAPQQVCLACDARSIREGLPLTTLLELQQKLGFKITVLHVAGTDEHELITYEGSTLQAQLAGRSAGYAEVSVTGAVDEAIAAFADAHGIDWLALAPHHYGFWEGLFHKSHTSRVLHLAHVPVLALHG